MEEDGITPEPPEDHLFWQEIGVAGAERVIAAVLGFKGVTKPNNVTGVIRPPAADLAADLEKLQAYFFEINHLNSFDRWEIWDKLYGDVRDAAVKLATAIDRLSESWSASHFHYTCQENKWGREESLLGPEARLAELARKAAADVSISLNQASVDRAIWGGDKWIEHREAHANHWLYGVGLPELFERNFKARYELPSKDGNSPAYQFALAVVDVAGLRAFSSISNMRLLERVHRKRRVPWLSGKLGRDAVG